MTNCVCCSRRQNERRFLKTLAKFIFYASIWACERMQTIFATQDIVVKQQLAEVHSRNSMQSLRGWIGDRVFSPAALQSTQHLLHNPDPLALSPTSSLSQHKQTDRMEKQGEGTPVLFINLFVEKHKTAFIGWFNKAESIAHKYTGLESTGAIQTHIFTCGI